MVKYLGNKDFMAKKYITEKPQYDVITFEYNAFEKVKYYFTKLPILTRIVVHK